MISDTLVKKNYTKSIVLLTIGAFLAQLVPFMVSPILTRFFTPEQFGVYGSIISAISVLGVVANGRYELAILLPKSDGDAEYLLILCFYICFLFGLSLSILGFFCKNINFFKTRLLISYIELIGLGAFLSGVFIAMSNFCNRHRMYTDISSSVVLKSGIANLTPLLLYPFIPNEFSLIISFLLSLLLSSAYLFFNLSRKKPLFKNPNLKRLKSIATEYNFFPKYSLPGAFLNALSLNGIVFLMAFRFSYDEIGYYLLVQKAYSAGSSIFGRSFSQVYFEQAAREKRECGSCHSLYITYLKKLSCTGLILGVTLYFFAEYFWGYVFGEKWVQCVKIMHVLMPYFVVSFVSATLSSTLAIYRKTSLELIIHLTIFITIILLFYINCICQYSFNNFITSLSIVMCLEYMLFLILYYNMTLN